MSSLLGLIAKGLGLDLDQTPTREPSRAQCCEKFSSGLHGFVLERLTVTLSPKRFGWATRFVVVLEVASTLSWGHSTQDNEVKGYDLLILSITSFEIRFQSE